MMTNLKTDLKKHVLPLTYGFSWLQDMILYSKSLKSVTWKTHLKMMQSFFLHNSFSIIHVMGLHDDKSWNRPQKTVMPLAYGFSQLQEVILYSKITKVSNMEGLFENDAVILFA